MKIRIGVLINNLDSLCNWQLRVLQGLLEGSELELTVIIKNNSVRNKKKGISTVFFNFSKIVLNIQNQIERRFFFKPNVGLKKNALFDSLHNIPTLELSPVKKQKQYYFNAYCTELVEDYDINLIIKLVDDTISGEILESKKYSIWELLHTDISFNKRGPVGFWEVFKKQPGTFSHILELSAKHNTGVVIDSAFFNRSWSIIETATIAKEGAVSLLFKNLKKLSNSSLSIPTVQQSIPHYSSPNLNNVLIYLFSFCGSLFDKIVLKIGAKHLGWRPECWTIFLGEGDFMKSELKDCKPLQMPKNEFWADPFLFKHNTIDFLFFENYSYKTKKGKISCGMIKDKKLVNVVDVLDLSYHLSFPFIFEEDGEIFLMPETSENNRLELYRAVNFPTEWELYTTAFEGERVADPFFYDDDNGQKWLFINKQAAETSPLNSELYIYTVDSLRLKSLTPHKQNPVVIDARVARNGGSLFVNENNLYRPSQRNINGIYGSALNINQIHKLTLDEYSEELINIVEPTFDKRLMAMHHVHQVDNLFVFDAAYRVKKNNI